jgi:hypothetical protein
VTNLSTFTNSGIPDSIWHLLAFYLNYIIEKHLEGHFRCIWISCEKVKVKVVPMLKWLNTMPGRRIGKWMYRSIFSWPGTSLRWVVDFTPLPLYHRGKSPWYPLDRRFRRRGEEKILDLTRTRIPTPRSPSINTACPRKERCDKLKCQLYNAKAGKTKGIIIFMYYSWRVCWYINFNCGDICIVFFLCCMLELSSESAHFPFVSLDISIVIWILEF